MAVKVMLAPALAKREAAAAPPATEKDKSKKVKMPKWTPSL